MDRSFYEQLPRMIDISCVRANHTIDEIDRMIAAAKEHRFICVFTLPSYTSYIAQQLKDEPDILVGGTVGFPSGGDTTSVKVFQAKELRQAGCNELDMVINLTALKSGDDQAVMDDIRAVVDAGGGLPVKTILEVSLLTDNEIRRACQLAVKAGATFVKSGTGWAGPTTLHHIELMSQSVEGKAKIKAAGGVRTLETIEEMTRVGCSRFGIGVSSALNLLKEAALRLDTIIE